MAAADIGCSLAEAAEAPAYDTYLVQAAGNAAPALHVVYINTSLRTKALAHAQVPTITCTSSNVVQTVLQVRCMLSCWRELHEKLLLMRWRQLHVLLHLLQGCFAFYFDASCFWHADCGLRMPCQRFSNFGALDVAPCIWTKVSLAASPG